MTQKRHLQSSRASTTIAPVSSTESTIADNTREDEAQESELADLICELAVTKRDAFTKK